MIGMSEAEFWDTTPRFFAARQQAFIAAQRSKWERARFIGWLAVLPYTGEGKSVRATDLFRFEWEPEPEAPAGPTDAELEALRQFEQEAKIIFEKQFGVKFDVPQQALNGYN